MKVDLNATNALYQLYEACRDTETTSPKEFLFYRLNSLIFQAMWYLIPVTRINLSNHYANKTIEKTNFPLLSYENYDMYHRFDIGEFFFDLESELGVLLYDFGKKKDLKAYSLEFSELCFYTIPMSVGYKREFLEPEYNMMEKINEYFIQEYSIEQFKERDFEKNMTLKIIENSKVEVNKFIDSL